MMFGSLFGQKSYQNISPLEGKNRLDTDKNIILIDVRTPDEYAQVHIPNSKSLPLNKLESGISKIAKDKESEIIVYCLSGARAASACSQLSTMGYTNVSNMGGIQSWKYETVHGH